AAISLDRRLLCERSALRHDDRCRNSAARGGIAQRLTVIAGGMRRHMSDCLRHGEYRIAGAACLEGAGALEILAFEIELRAHLLVKEVAGQDRRAMHMRRDA